MVETSKNTVSEEDPVEVGKLVVSEDSDISVVY